jgi:hypothetical protein
MMSASLYIGSMPYEERRTWILGACAVVSYAAYLVVILGRARGIALTEVNYRAPLLWSIGGSITASIVLSIVTSFGTPRDKDQRDREIDRAGEHVGYAFVVVGAVAALALTMYGGARFWIANALYLGFTLSALVGAATKVVAYRRGLWPW